MIFSAFFGRTGNFTGRDFLGGLCIKPDEPVLNNLVINEDEIKKDLEMTHGLIFSQQVMLKLIDKGWTREEAYDTVQPIAMEVWNTGQHFMDLLLKDSKIKTTLSDEEVKSIFNYRYHLKNVDAIYQRCGINVE